MIFQDLTPSTGVFDRSGLAALSDLQSEECRDIFSLLDKQQSAFRREAHKLRSNDYQLPNDPLHCWSRVWEYPYVYYHLSRFVKSLPEGSRPVVTDVGSGVTFFPFSIAGMGYDVICTDIDPVCGKDIARICEVVPCPPGSVGFRLIDNKELPFSDSECDAVFCISVLEHIADFENTVREIARVLKPGGLCLVTCDLGLDVRADTQLNTSEYDRLLHVINEHFSLLYPERTIHPANVLTDLNSPYSDCKITYLRIGFRLFKQNVSRIFGQRPKYRNVRDVGNLAILGLALTKRPAGGTGEK